MADAQSINQSIADKITELNTYYTEHYPQDGVALTWVDRSAADSEGYGLRDAGDDVFISNAAGKVVSIEFSATYANDLLSLFELLSSEAYKSSSRTCATFFTHDIFELG